MTSLAVLMLAPFICRLGKRCQYDATGVPMHRDIDDSGGYQGDEDLMLVVYALN
jgi:hypothetical protein